MSCLNDNVMQKGWKRFVFLLKARVKTPKAKKKHLQ